MMGLGNRGSRRKNKDPMVWKIYYDDWSTFTSQQGSPEDAPPNGIQVIAVKDDSVGGRGLLQGFDYYYWSRDGEWSGSDHTGMVDQFANCGATALKMGRSISVPRFREIFDFAKKDPKTRVWLK